MKILNNRSAVGKAVNFAQNPVLSMDLANLDGYGLSAGKVRIDAGKFPDGTPYIIRAEVRVYRDAKKLTTQAAPVCVSASFTYTDFVEMAEYATAPLIREDQDVVVMIYNSNIRQMYAPVIVHTGRVNRHCITPLPFIDADFSAFLNLAIVNKQ